MKLEEQCCSLELAKKLKELGVKQESYFNWYISLDEEFFVSDENICACEPICSAFTVAELGEMLTAYKYAVYTHKIPYSDRATDLCMMWRSWEDVLEGLDFYATTEADARAKLLIHLLEKGIVKP